MLANNLRLILFRFDTFAQFYRSYPWQVGETIWKVLWIVIAIVGVMLAHRTTLAPALRILGLTRPVAFPLAMAFLATLPALLIFVVFAPLNPNLKLLETWMTAIVSPLSEEILFRAYLFRQLYQYARWPFWAAALMNALPFAWGHIGQAGSSLSDLLLVTLITGLGAALFGWLLVKWDYNAWFIIGMHSLMNFWWYVFVPAETVIGGRVSNIARIIAIVAAILITVYRNQLNNWRLRRSTEVVPQANI